MSTVEIIFQEICAGYNTLTAHQNNYHPQEQQRTDGLGMQERAAEQLATHPVCLPNGPSDRHGVIRESQYQAS
jgi:hypothetical protein